MAVSIFPGRSLYHFLNGSAVQFTDAFYNTIVRRNSAFGDYAQNMVTAF